MFPHCLVTIHLDPFDDSRTDACSIGSEVIIAEKEAGLEEVEQK